MMRCISSIFLIIFSFSAMAQVIDFDRPEKVNSVRTAQLRLKLSREYTFMIPGAGKPIRKQETMDLVLLTDIKIEKLNQKGQPVTLLLTPRIVGGALNGRAINQNLLKGRMIRAELEKYPCKFTAADGKSALPNEAIVILSALFRQQQNITYPEILGQSRKFTAGQKWVPETNMIIKNLKKRNVAINKNNLKAQAQFENKFKVNGVQCVAVVLNLSSVGTHAYDFQVKTRLILPVSKADGGVIRLAREGVEVVDRKLISGDFAASGSEVQIITKEQMEVTYVPPKKSSSFLNIF